MEQADDFAVLLVVVSYSAHSYVVDGTKLRLLTVPGSKRPINLTDSSHRIICSPLELVLKQQTFLYDSKPLFHLHSDAPYRGLRQVLKIFF